MEKFLLIALLCGTMFPGMAQNNVTAKNETGMKTIRLVYPQWQGGNIAQWITEVKDPEQWAGHIHRPGFDRPCGAGSDRWRIG